MHPWFAYDYLDIVAISRPDFWIFVHCIMDIMLNNINQLHTSLFYNDIYH